MTPKMPIFSASDLARLRGDLLADQGHVHLDNAGASLMAAPVHDVLLSHLAREARIGGYVAQEKAAESLEASYHSMARLLGASADEIAFTASATDAWDRLFYSLPLKPGDRIVTAFNEYCSNYVAMLDRVRKTGADIIVIGSDHRGDLDGAAFEAALDDERVKLVAISHVPSSSGQINDVAAIGRMTRARGIPYLLDGCQAVGQLPVDVREIGCDMLTGTARKFLRGPRGIGFLYVSRSMLGRLEPVMLTNQSATWTARDRYDLRTDARLFEAWERSVASQLALGAAVEYALEAGIERIAARASGLAAHLRRELANLPGIELTDPGAALSAIVTFRHRRKDPAAIKALMAERDIAVQVASIVHTRIDLEARGIESCVRVSPHYFNSEEEISRFLEALKAI